jgi:hypothetical protein
MIAEAPARGEAGRPGFLDLPRTATAKNFSMGLEL